MDRVVAVRERLSRAKAVAEQALRAAPPCRDCRYSMFETCQNPAYAEPSFEPSTGRYREKFQTGSGVARSDDGLCGPEGLLFESKPEGQLKWERAVRSAWTATRAAILGGNGLLLAYLLLR